MQPFGFLGSVPDSGSAIMERIRFGRRRLRFSKGTVTLASTSMTEQAYPGEDEHSFTNRLLERYGDEEGTIEIVFKAGQPKYAIVTIGGAD